MEIEIVKASRGTKKNRTTGSLRLSSWLLYWCISIMFVCLMMSWVCLLCGGSTAHGKSTHGGCWMHQICQSRVCWVCCTSFMPVDAKTIKSWYCPGFLRMRQFLAVLNHLGSSWRCGVKSMTNLCNFEHLPVRRICKIPVRSNLEAAGSTEASCWQPDCWLRALLVTSGTKLKNPCQTMNRDQGKLWKTSPSVAPVEINEMLGCIIHTLQKVCTVRLLWAQSKKQEGVSTGYKNAKILNIVWFTFCILSNSCWQRLILWFSTGPFCDWKKYCEFFMGAKLLITTCTSPRSIHTLQPVVHAFCGALAKTGAPLRREWGLTGLLGWLIDIIYYYMGGS